MRYTLSSRSTTFFEKALDCELRTINKALHRNMYVIVLCDLVSVLWIPFLLLIFLKALSTASAYHIHAVGGKKYQLVRT
jgi:hypothetical protein